VDVQTKGYIITHGAGANGIFAQSVGGGGGIAGEIGLGIGFAGSVGGDGSGGAVSVTHFGNIMTTGDAAHGIVAQSAGGKQSDDGTTYLGLGGKVNVTLDGNIIIQGAGADGILVQSVGIDGADDISIAILGGTVQGGSESGAGVHFIDGANNTLHNDGTISSLSGVAIVGTSGNERIDNDGIVTGSVELGAGTNMFNNNAAATFNSGSKVTLGDGANTLTNAGRLSPGGLGTVHTTDLTGNLVQTNSGIFSVDMDSSSGKADRLNVSGTADLAGVADLNIVNPGWAAPGIHQTTIVTGTGGATNSGLSLTYQPSAVMDYKLLYPNSTDVVLSTSIDFSPKQGLNRNQRAIGDAISTIQRAGGAESISPVVAELFTLPDRKGLGNAYNQLSPVSYNNSTRTSLDSSRYYSKTVQNRMASLRAVAKPVRVSGENAPGQKKKVLLAYNGADADIGKLLSREEQTESGRRFGVWASGFGQWGKQDTADGFVGYDFSISGLALGFDYNFSKGLIAGFSLGGSSSDVDLKQNAGSSDIDSYLGSLYASFFTNNLYLESVLTYGRQDYDNERNIVVGNLRNTASSDHNGDLFNAYLSGGYYFSNKGLRFGPFASLQYTYLDEDGFEETGAGGMNLVVDDRQTDALVSHLGMRVGGFLDTNIGRLIPEVSLAWLYDFGLDDQVVTAGFAGSPGGSFSVEGQDVENNGVALGAGLTLLPKSGIVISLGYRGELRDNFSSHAAIGQIRFEF
jgi:outer membrane autotransporter protein